jgi:hypothetical protein
MKLKWPKSEYAEVLIPRIGGLHTTMNFLWAIVEHMESSAVVDVWVENRELRSNASVQMMSGKKYARAVRFHQFTVQVFLTNPIAKTEPVYDTTRY